MRQLKQNLFSFQPNGPFLGLRSVKTVFLEPILLHQAMAHFKTQQHSFPRPHARKGTPDLVKEDLPVVPCTAVYFLVVRLGG